VGGQVQWAIREDSAKDHHVTEQKKLAEAFSNCGQARYVLFSICGQVVLSE
jgi:hypothetical protein